MEKKYRKKVRELIVNERGAISMLKEKTKHLRPPDGYHRNHIWAVLRGARYNEAILNYAEKLALEIAERRKKRQKEQEANLKKLTI